MMNDIKPKFINNCWICEQWIPYEFILVNPLKGNHVQIDPISNTKIIKIKYEKHDILDPIFIHFEFDNWYPW